MLLDTFKEATENTVLGGGIQNMLEGAKIRSNVDYKISFWGALSPDLMSLFKILYPRFNGALLIDSKMLLRALSGAEFYCKTDRHPFSGLFSRTTR